MPRHTDTPSFLIVMAEQVSAFADPNYAACGVEAPTLRGLAAASTRFEHAHCNSPVCGPSRLSFLTGRYACHCEGYDNGSILPPHMPTFAHMLVQAGYRTAISGRMHLHGLDPHRGFEERLSSEIINPLPVCPAIWPGALEPIRPLAPAPPVRFEPVFSDSPMCKHDEYVTQRACEFLRDAKAAGDRRPFCLTVGYFAAHSGSKPNPAYRDAYQKYRQRDLPLPRFSPGDYERLPEHIRRLHQYSRSDQRIFSDEYHRHELAWYFARVEYVDQQVARLLAALRDEGLDNDTVVIFTADHGAGMGRHGIWGKMNFYEQSQRVPLYVRVPGAPGGRTVCQPVSLVDVLPTLAELAGHAPPFPCDGRSLVPLVRGTAAEEEDAVVFSEYHGHLSPSGMYMALQNGFKYCHYLKEPCELYDLTRDPGEERNLIDDPSHEPIRARLEAEIRKRVDIDRLEQQIRTHNAQRDAAANILESSPATARRLAESIQEFRRRLNEPWWDDGAYMAQFEPSTINPRAPAPGS